MKYILLILSIIVLYGCNQNDRKINNIDEVVCEECKEQLHYFYNFYRIYYNGSPKNNTKDTVFKLYKLISDNCSKNITIKEKLQELPKEFSMDFSNIGIFDKDVNLVWYIQIEAFQSTKCFYRFIFVFDDDVKICKARQAMFHEGNAYNEVISKCLNEMRYCIFQLEVDWNSFLKNERLTDSTSARYKDYLNKYNELIEKSKRKNN